MRKVLVTILVTAVILFTVLFIYNIFSPEIGKKAPEPETGNFGNEPAVSNEEVKEVETKTEKEKVEEEKVEEIEINYLNSNELVETEKYKFTVKGYYFTEEFKNESANQYAANIKVKNSEKETILVIPIQIMNIETNLQKLANTIKYAIVNDKYNYPLETAEKWDYGFKTYTEIVPLEEKDMYFFAIIPKEAENIAESLKLKFAFDNGEEGYETFEEKDNRYIFELEKIESDPF